MIDPRINSGLLGRTRREFLVGSGGGFVAAALAAMMGEDGGLPLVHQPLPMAKAKSVIFLYMYGGPSHIDTFDRKPALNGMNDKTIKVKTFGRGGHKNEGRIVEPRWKFRQYGECGKWVSDLFPHVGTCVDDIAFVHSMTADSPIHGSAMLQMNTGKIQSGSPCIGTWVSYGLGTANRNLPSFVVMLDPRGGPISGGKNWSAGYMPARYQATVVRAQGTPILDLENPKGVTRGMQRHMLDVLGEYNQEHLSALGGNDALAARMESYELAYRMQATAPEAVDLDSESEETKGLYGVDDPKTEVFGRQCLLARRLVERGVRMIQIYSGGNHVETTWDAHNDLVKNHTLHAGETDKPIAGLIKDLKRRGMLDETLIVWGGEFGRQPTAEYAEGTGRDHNSYGFTMWMAGGGVKGGISVGETDELGSAAVGQRYHVKHLHATMLRLMGLDPNGLTYFYGGLDQRLVGVEGAEPIQELLT